MTAHNPPDHTDVHDDEQLLCGRLLSEVWDAWERQVDDPHRHECPHCRQAVLGLDELETAVRDLRDEAADTEGYDASTLTRRVMDVVRLELRPGRPLPLGEPAEDLWIMEAVAARVLRAAAETVPGVRAGSCRLLPDPEGGAGPVEVRLEIHAPADACLPDLADQVRGRVQEAADRELGMGTAAVDIRITDLVDTPPDGQEGSTP
ncbi:Asp23/Gls24 family envelope stress response protein [Streptomyces liliifuscus]|uniref:Asp23/Gls24 family envelope stress response protein n=1 Tax=Streptomyces liliifuscus TaxID=2797636 RepID=A0A7T7L308_9ACTN|nr:Asp23/Gls24 family envelope stress response protein [Streptomyces liliifuscus]